MSRTRTDCLAWTLDLGALGEQDFGFNYDYTPGSPERGPSYSSGGEPAEPPDVTITTVYLLTENEDRNCTWMLDYIDEDEIGRIHDAIEEVESSWEE